MVILLGLSSLFAQQENNQPIQRNNTPLYGVFPNVPPLAIYDPPNSPTGILLDALEWIMLDAKLSYKIEHAPVARFRRLLTDGLVDIAIFTTADHQFNRYLSSKEAVVNLTLSAFWLPNNKWESVEAISTKRIIKNYAYMFPGFFQKVKIHPKQFNFINSKSTISGLMMLEAGRGDYLLDYAELVMEKNKSLSLNLKSQSLSSVKVHFLLRKDVSNAQEILTQVDTAIIRLKQQSFLKRIIEKYNNKVR